MEIIPDEAKEVLENGGGVGLGQEIFVTKISGKYHLILLKYGEYRRKFNTIEALDVYLAKVGGPNDIYKDAYGFGINPKELRLMCRPGQEQMVEEEVTNFFKSVIEEHNKNKGLEL